MATLYSERMSIIVPYSPTQGSFVYNHTAYSCRVSFHESYYNSRQNGGSVDFAYRPVTAPATGKSSQTIEGLLRTLTEVEDKLQLANSDRIGVWPTNLTNVVSLRPSEWWLDPIRVTFLTCLIRELESDLATTLKSPGERRYLVRTRPAVDAFLSGATFYHGKRYDGWVNEFKIPANVNLLQKTPSENPTVEACHHLGWTRYTQNLMKR